MPPHCPETDTLKQQFQTLKKSPQQWTPHRNAFKREREKKHFEEMFLCTLQILSYPEHLFPNLKTHPKFPKNWPEFSSAKETKVSVHPPTTGCAKAICSNSKYWQYTQIINHGLHYISILFKLSCKQDRNILFTCYILIIYIAYSHQNKLTLWLQTTWQWCLCLSGQPTIVLQIILI